MMDPIADNIRTNTLKVFPFSSHPEKDSAALRRWALAVHKRAAEGDDAAPSRAVIVAKEGTIVGDMDHKNLDGRVIRWRHHRLQILPLGDWNTDKMRSTVEFRLEQQIRIISCRDLSDVWTD
ncbi:hypothetical protein [Corynebacterium pygosceleis]|uniref:hypothetical protein n=1 Tax=Corynebacterium pygosceleis TaxID=2800406 RepID=UPI0019089A50|nr:hypothetical protein [Corynebacterium pygosceleis]MCL0120652.1 hypothetical protein [Corynebacterium pygosceleis]